MAGLNDGLVACYPFAGNADDSSGNGHNAILNGNPVFTVDRFGRTNDAIHLDGVSDFVWLGDGLRSSNLSAAVWFRIQQGQAPNSVQWLIRDRQYGWGIIAGSPPGYQVPIADISIYPFYRSFNEPETLLEATPAQDYGDGSWHLAVLTYDGLSLNLYLDGLLKANLSYGVAAGIQYYEPGGLAIGRDGDNPASYFAGDIDDVRIYNRALSANEIQALYTGMDTCPQDLVVPTDPGLCSASNVPLTAPSFPTLCGVVSISNNAPAIFPVGETEVIWTVTEGGGIQWNCVQKVTVVDNQPPKIVCPANIVVGCSVDPLVAVSYSATATDNCDPSPALSYSPPSGSGFGVGTNTVLCIASDANGNQSSCSFMVTREPLGFTGFLSPIGGADTTGGTFSNPVRTFKLNSTIPVKFTLDCSGSPVTTGNHVLQVIQYTSQTVAGDPIDATPTDVATTGDRFSLNSDHWQFNLDTKATGMSTGIWLLLATLSDGTQHSAWIQLK